MKKLILLLGIILLAAGCASPEPEKITGNIITGKSDVLIVFYSWSPLGNTRSAALEYQRQLNADLVEIEPDEDYPVRQNAVYDRVGREMKSGTLPGIRPLPVKLEKYAVIIVGTPVWFSDCAAPVKTFLVRNDLSGKTVIPFCTSGGGNPGKTFDTVASLCPKSKVVQGLAIVGREAKQSEKEISGHLKTAGIIK